MRLAELGDEDWTAASTDGLIVRACRAAGFEPNLVSLTRDQLAIRALISRGLAVTLASQLLAEPFKDLAFRPIADHRALAHALLAICARGAGSAGSMRAAGYAPLRPSHT